jgi:NAD(P)-dependent dehydrogenase (short-subunit alcohol dehydrogenase family)
LIIIQGAYTPIGLTLLTSLAQQGAQVIAIVPSLADPALLSIIDLIRYTHKNDLIYAESCDLSSPGSIKDFCAQLIKSTGGGVAGEFRLDAIIFAHEYGHIGGWRCKNREEETRRREEGLLATFFFTTLLLPVLLTAPSDRDVRIINLVNPFYSAAVPQFDLSKPTKQPNTSTSIWREEGRRSLRSVLFIRHLQRVLDALPAGAKAVPVVSGDKATTNSPKKISNIIAVTASPGISRADTIAPFWCADASLPSFSVVGSIMYAESLRGERTRTELRIDIFAFFPSYGCSPSQLRPLCRPPCTHCSFRTHGSLHLLLRSMERSQNQFRRRVTA